MLSDAEFEFYRQVHRKVIEAIQSYRVETGAKLKDVPTAKLVKPAFDIYEKFTGIKPEPGMFEHLWHHQASEYGPPCENCGKHLRTPRAKYCVECGQDV